MSLRSSPRLAPRRPRADRGDPRGSRPRALESGKARQLDEVLLEELPDALELLRDESLADLRGLLRLEPGDLVPQLQDALFELALLPLPRGGTRLEEDRSAAMSFPTAGSSRRDRNSSGVVILAAPSRSASNRARRATNSSSCFATIWRLARVRVSSRRMRRSPSLTSVAFPDPQFTHNAARGVLYLLDVGIDHELPQGHHGRREWRWRPKGRSCRQTGR